MKVLGLIDSFKGTLTSIELGNILKNELRKKKIDVEYIPISDGGDGFLDCMNSNFLLQRKYVTTKDPLNRKIRTYYLYDEENDTAYIELAKTAGLNLLKKEEYNPFITSTYGTGKMILNAINKGIKNIVVGIGGSSTNDGGSGILAGLGVKFYDENNQLIEVPSNSCLKKIKSIDLTDFNKNIEGIKFLVVSDVTNPLLGPNGATYTYSPQKGAKSSDLSVLEANLVNYAHLVEKITGEEFRNNPGSGAAGGVGFAFMSFFNANVVSGINYILDKINFDEYKDYFDYIVTGEGKIDKQSLSGKVVFEVLKRSYPKKVILVSAINELNDNELKEMGVYKSFSIVNSITTMEKSLKSPRYYFRKLIRDNFNYE